MSNSRDTQDQEKGDEVLRRLLKPLPIQTPGRVWSLEMKLASRENRIMIEPESNDETVRLEALDEERTAVTRKGCSTANRSHLSARAPSKGVTA